MMDFIEEAIIYINERDIKETNLIYDFVLNQGKYLNEYQKEIDKYSFTNNRKDDIYSLIYKPEFIELYFEPFTNELMDKILNFIINPEHNDEDVNLLLEEYDFLKLKKLSASNEYYNINNIDFENNIEVIKTLSKSPDWKPGKQMGIPSKVRFIIPVNFKLQ